MTIVARLSTVIDSEWLRVKVVRVGHVPTGLGTPDCYVTVVDDGTPVLRVEVFGSESSEFQAAIVWRDSVVIGFGSAVHAISVADHTAQSIPLDSYFVDFYPTQDYVLLASGERLLRMEPDHSILWASKPLGIDGVVVHELGGPVVRGEGEWDPPDGWQPFAIVAEDGSTAP